MILPPTGGSATEFSVTESYHERSADKVLCSPAMVTTDQYCSVFESIARVTFLTHTYFRPKAGMIIS